MLYLQRVDNLIYALNKHERVKILDSEILNKPITLSLNRNSLRENPYYKKPFNG